MKKSIISFVVALVFVSSIGVYANQQMNCGRNCPRGNYVDCPMKCENMNGNQICGYPRASTNVCQRVNGCPRYNSCPMR